MERYSVRQMNLNASYRNTSSLSDVLKADQNEMSKVFLKPNEFCFQLELEHEYYGIKPRENRTNPGFSYDYSLCHCNKTPSYRFKKQMKYKGNFSSSMVYANASEFKMFKLDVENKVNIFDNIGLKSAITPLHFLQFCMSNIYVNLTNYS